MALLPQSKKDLLFKGGHLRYVKFLLSVIFLLGILLGVGLHLWWRETGSDHVGTTAAGVKKIPFLPLQLLSSQELAHVPLEPTAPVFKAPLLQTEQHTNLTIEERLHLDSYIRGIYGIRNLKELTSNIDLFNKLSSEFPAHLFDEDPSLAAYKDLFGHSGDFISVINSISAARDNREFTLTSLEDNVKKQRQSFEKLLPFIYNLSKEHRHYKGLYEELLCFFTKYDMEIDTLNAFRELDEIIRDKVAFESVIREDFGSYISKLKQAKDAKEKDGNLPRFILLINKEFADLEKLISNIEAIDDALALLQRESSEVEATKGNVDLLSTFNNVFTNCSVAQALQASLEGKIAEEKRRLEEEERKRAEEEARKRAEDEEQRRKLEEQRIADEQKTCLRIKKSTEDQKLSEERSLARGTRILLKKQKVSSEDFEGPCWRTGTHRGAKSLWWTTRGSKTVQRDKKSPMFKNFQKSSMIKNLQKNKKGPKFKDPQRNKDPQRSKESLMNKKGIKNLQRNKNKPEDQESVKRTRSVQSSRSRRGTKTRRRARSH